MRVYIGRARCALGFEGRRWGRHKAQSARAPWPSAGWRRRERRCRRRCAARRWQTRAAPTRCRRRSRTRPRSSCPPAQSRRWSRSRGSTASQTAVLGKGGATVSGRVRARQALCYLLLLFHDAPAATAPRSHPPPCGGPARASAPPRCPPARHFIWVFFRGGEGGWVSDFALRLLRLVLLCPPPCPLVPSAACSAAFESTCGDTRKRPAQSSSARAWGVTIL